MEYNKYIKDLEENYTINGLSFVEEHLVFTTFISQIIREDEFLSDAEKEELHQVMLKAYNRLKDKYGEMVETREYCWKKSDSLSESNPRFSHYYRIIVTLFYEESISNDPSSQFTPTELFMELLDDIDSRYPEQYYHFITQALDDLY